MNILSELNPAQQEAVQSTDGPVLIVAGPGSGKTRVITHRITHLIDNCGVSPYRILAVTFTNKAAREMKERVQGMLGETAEGITLSTFHSLCARILRSEAAHIELDPRFIIYGESEQLTLIGRSLEELSLSPKEYPIQAIRATISSAKAKLFRPKNYTTQNYFEEVAKRVYERYQRMLTESKALDFDDLLMKTVYLFREHPEVLSHYQHRFSHVMIDEFQDTNQAQYILARQLAGEKRNLCVVGDPDQSIYSWRSANLRHILDFEKDHEDAKVVFLEQNYRSTQTILDAASHLISCNKIHKQKQLWTQNIKGDPIRVVEVYNEQEEAQFVVSDIEMQMEQGRSANTFAVMYRTNAQSRALEEALIRYGMPYKLVGATRFYERREIRDVLAYLKLIHNPFDTVSLSRIINVPGRGIGQRTLTELGQFAREKDIPIYSALNVIYEGKEETRIYLRGTQALNRFTDMLEELIALSYNTDLLSLFDAIMERSGYRDYAMDDKENNERWNNILEFRGLVGDYTDLDTRDGLTMLLERVALVADLDNLNSEVDAITLITLHQAKGLEFPIAYITGMDEGILPHFRAFGDDNQMEEERRLFYVGITRAKEKVCLLHAFRRSLGGGSRSNTPSRFLKDLPTNLIAKGAMKGSPISSTKQASPVITHSLLQETKEGDRVLHSNFGEGTVVSCSPIRDDCEVTIAFRKGVGIKKLLLSLAPLEKL